MSSLDKMVSSSKRSPDMLVSSQKLTSSQSRMVGNIKDAAYEVGYNKKHIEDQMINGVHVRILRGNDVEIDNHNGYNLSHKIRWNNNAKAKDPTWNQLCHFLKNNVLFKMKVFGEATYKVGEFMCADFASALHNSAEATGILCASVTTVRRNSSTGHALVLFNTTDKGWVFVDPTSGMVFSKRNFFDQGDDYTPDFAMIAEKLVTRSQLLRAMRDHFEKKFDFVEIQW
jgi:hypothetical protein